MECACKARRRDGQRRMKLKSREIMEEAPTSSSRMWAEMAPDVLANIFLRLPFKQRLLDIPSVCKPWKLASQDPLCWQKLNFAFWRPNSTTSHAELISRLLQRSQGCLLQLTLPLIPDRHALDLLARSAPLLEKLHISGSCADDEWATYAAPWMPRITDLNLRFSNGKLSHLALEAFGRSCKGITKLMWTSNVDKNCTIDDSEAFSIARHYPLLRHLELESNSVSTQGLRAILDNCPALEHLDVKGCPNLKNMDATLLSLCRSRFKYFFEPASFDSTSDDSDDFSDCSYSDENLSSSTTSSDFDSDAFWSAQRASLSDKWEKFGKNRWELSKNTAGFMGKVSNVNFFFV